MSRRFVVVSGLPAAGKTTLGRALAEELDLPLVDKDDLLESLFETEGVGDARWRSQLSRRADTMLIDQACANPSGAVVVAHWRHPYVDGDSGTPLGWLSALPDIELVEVHC